MDIKDTERQSEFDSVDNAAINGDFSESEENKLLGKMFPGIHFQDQQSFLYLYKNEDTYYSLPYKDNSKLSLSLSLKDSIEDYFTDNKTKDRLLVVELDGMGHAGGFYHAYLGLFDGDGNLLTPAFDSVWDEHFFGDHGYFKLYDCNGVKHILAITGGCPNGGCCYDIAALYKIKDGKFEEIIDGVKGVGIEDGMAGEIVILADGNKLTLNKIFRKGLYDDCQEEYYTQLKWNKDTCRFE